MNKYKNVIICIMLLILLPLSIKFIKFSSTQRDVLGVLANKQVFQIEQENIDISKIEPSKQTVKIPQDILNQMQVREQEKQARIKAEKEEQERIEKEKQLKIEQEKILLAKQKEEQKVTSRSIVENRKEETISTSTDLTDNSGWIKFTATFYDNCIQCCGKTTGRTAMGTIATAGRTVAMPSSYKFGTKIQIKGMGTYVVEDRGGAIQGNRIDIFVNSHAEALRMGRKTVYLKVVQ